MNNYPLNPNLKPFWGWKLRGSQLVYNYGRYRVLYGGRASSKTHEFAGVAAKIAAEHRTRFLCVRRFQNKIKESVYTVIRNKIDDLMLKGFDVQAANIYHKNGSEFAFYGIERNVDEIKSFEGADILWIEEAHNLTKEQWEILEPTIRKEGSEIWISFNPRLVTDFIYQRFVVDPPSNAIVRKINYDENDYLSNTLLESINELKERDYEAYKHIYLGHPLANDEQAVIRREWIEAAIELEIDRGPCSIGYDVADSGDDKNAMCVAFGGYIDDCVEWQAKEHELNKSADRVRLEAIKNGGFVIYDSIGVGAHTGSAFKRDGFNNFSGFNAGGKVFKPVSKYNGIKNKEYFSNIKAQAWWLIADRFRATYLHSIGETVDPELLISINPKIRNLDGLITELSSPKRDFDRQGRVKVESKDDLKARGINSPNRADALIMALSGHLVRLDQINTDLKISGF